MLKKNRKMLRGIKPFLSVTTENHEKLRRNYGTFRPENFSVPEFWYSFVQYRGKIRRNGGIRDRNWKIINGEERIFYWKHRVHFMQEYMSTCQQYNYFDLTLASSLATLIKSSKNSIGSGFSLILKVENLPMTSQDKSMAHCSMLAREWIIAIRLSWKKAKKRED